MDPVIAGRKKGAYRNTAGKPRTCGQSSSILCLKKVIVSSARSISSQNRGPLTNLTISTSGNFAESTSPEHQMHWIIENAKLVRASEGIAVIVDSLKMLAVKHEQLM